MRFRLAEDRDLPNCRSLLNPALRLSRRVEDQLPTLWSALAVCGTFSIVEDPIKPYPDSIEGFGASVFVDDRFVEEFLSERRNYLDATLYERILAGRSPVLSEAQIAAANSGDGLSLVVLSYGLRDHDLSNPVTQQVQRLGNAAFYALHAGYQLKTILNEVFGDVPAQYLNAGGFQLMETSAAGGGTKTGPAAPYLFALRREWVERGGALHMLSSLFHPPAARIGFSSSERRVLVQALFNRSDTEIAAMSGVAIDSVKKTWRRIYDRVSLRLPYLIAGERKPGDSGRSSEKRRHVLDYLRSHPEELRPARRA
jgi:DNA-binding CsgD family transcriptional regulator